MTLHPSHPPILPKEIWTMILDERGRQMRKVQFRGVMQELETFMDAFEFGWPEGYSYVNDDYVAQKITAYRWVLGRV